MEIKREELKKLLDKNNMLRNNLERVLNSQEKCRRELNFLRERDNKLQAIELMFINKIVDLNKLNELVMDDIICQIKK